MTPTPSSGGYVILQAPLIRAGFNLHTSALDRPVSETDLAAINAIQQTPWRINRWILDVVCEAWDKDLDVGDLPVQRPNERPKRLGDDVWAAMDAPARETHREFLAEAHQTRASLEGRRHALLDRLSVAQSLAKFESIWYPHTRDFRGRIYPVPTAGPQPQGDDLSKGLLMFSSGLPLGPDGLFWLCVRAANCYGHDKLTLEERVEWVLENQPDIRLCARFPFGVYQDFWASAAEPWSFLATCHELVQAFDDPDGFVSHLPIPLDGSCNGLQHLSAMALDPIGAAATNLLPGPRQDIYEEVAKVVREQVAQDVVVGLPEAIAWDGKVTRAVCKRSVMTTPYGVTGRGIRRQLVSDGHVPSCQDQGNAAEYLTKALVEALGKTVRASRDVMGWLQAVSNALAKAGLPFDWTTPSGSRVRQAYYQMTTRQVQTLVGRVTLASEVPGGMLNPKKQSLGSAPNYVHSFDAAAAALTVLACHEDGVRSFALIHDSFGTHARNTTTLANILREQFAKIYRTDWLQRTYQEVREYAPHVAIPVPPKGGDLDIGLVLESEFFFS